MPSRRKHNLRMADALPDRNFDKAMSEPTTRRWLITLQFSGIRASRLKAVAVAHLLDHECEPLTGNEPSASKLFQWFHVIFTGHLVAA